MIKTLQKRFVTTAMLAITILLLVLLGAINIGYSLISGRQEDAVLNMISQSEGMSPPDKAPRGKEKKGLLEPPMDEDAAMSARYFLVRLNEEGEIVQTDISRISSVTEEEAQEYAMEASKRTGDEGTIHSFKYKSAASWDNRGQVIIFLDTALQRHSVLMVLLLSVFIGILCWGCMLLLVILLSKKAIIPIAKNMEKQKQFVTNAGHEIKTPLAIIMANTDAMELHSGESKWSRNIRNQTIRLSGLMQNLLTLSKMDEAGQKLRKDEFSISGLLEETLRPFYESAALNSVTIKEDIRPGVMIHANRENITQLVSVLMDNAVKYTNKGGEIGVILKKEDRKVKLQVNNTCDSLPVDAPEKLFDRFYRGDSARTQKSGGYGIGLSVAAAIVEAHKGKIQVKYEEDRIHFQIEL